ncbi:MAG TPA: C25 family cysteine peptidase, partial [Candidatus Lokiarchaeia archaeon]|nr:C25 family cysteine peptidase [Candidatus Lokiarchaeia archaeon]
MGRHNLSPAWQFTIAVILIGSLVAGVGIALGMTAGTYDRPTWIPQGSSGDLGTVNWSKFYANPKYSAEMVIITSPELVSALQPLAQWKTEKGTPCIINTTENISATYPGRDLPEQIRNCLRDLYYNGSLEWVLLAGNSTTVPPRYVYNDDTVQVTANELEDQHGQTDLYYKPTDFYYSALAGTWDENGNGIFGESANVTKTTDEIIWTPNVYVGRFPANSYAEMQGLVDKTIKYETNPPIGTWMQKMVLGGIISDPSPRNNDEAYVVQKIADTDVPSSITKAILLQTTAAYSPAPNVNNITNTNMQFESAVAAGASLAHFEGHGNYYELASSVGSNDVLDTSSAASLPNNDQLTFFYTAACDSAAFDLYPTSTLMYALLVPQDRGAIGYIGAMRVSWYFDLNVEQEAGHWLESLNRGLAQAFWQNFFINGTHQPGKALADAKLTYINSAWASFQNESNAATNGFFGMEYERKELLSFTLFGDPELNVYTQEPKDFSIALPATVYGGEEIQAPIRDTAGYSVPGATVCFQSADGLYYNSTHLGTSTNLDVRVPILNNSESYNV